ncbi:sigma-70 family RNA polymerase sigma factor [Kitasatospora sp. NBC_01287]|uniref:BACON domain-containing protein n=1 Tax=Kitasatospora sp. NBC_01287 TaxID=2903573 RepID=UPI0022542111|nr:sigma-70 family RNA polymerase sigma factor [Kitasatospora sp. NBC_01287]MCX4748257.1 sigma-70 family RNA polymerase sigma factor [Kitasatospora sp. NBC_01287]
MTHRLDPAAAFDQLQDGLYTYCLSVLCDRRAALAALDEARRLADANAERLTDPGLRRAWLYSLARYACVRRLGTAQDPAVDGGGAALLGELAWPEAAGTTAEQREALELSVRHRLTPLELAAVLGIGTEAAQRLLAEGAAEVERTRRVLLVLGVGSCPELARLGGAGADHWRSWLLGPALRRELVGHVAGCPTCRGTAERVEATLGTSSGGTAGLPLLSARAAGPVSDPPADPAADPGLDPGAGPVLTPVLTSGVDPDVDPDGSAIAERPARPARFDQRGFPRHRAPGLLERHRPGGDLHERAVLIRQRALTTGVLAAVLSAPVAALWLAHRDATATTDTAAAVSSVRVADGTPDPDPALQAPGAVPAVPLPAQAQAHGQGGEQPPDSALAAAVVRPPAAAGAAPGMGLPAAAGAETLLPAVQGAAVPVPAAGALALSDPGLRGVPVPAAPAAPVAQLTVEAGAYGNRTVLTLTDTGQAPLDWRAVPDCDWLRLSRDAGTLSPGQRITVTVTVDEQRAPSGHWTAAISLPPSEAVVTLAGDNGTAPAPTPSAAPSTPVPSASANPSGAASPSPSVTASAGSSASTAPSSSDSPTANPTSGASATPSPSSRPSSSPSATPTPSATPSGDAPGPIPSPAPTSATSSPSSSSPAR